jgi:protein-S-isoprenylcysteine O-methyltransferase Ste14
MQHPEPRRVPGRYVVYFIILFAIFCAAFATWGIRAMRKLPRPPGKTGTSPFG